MKFFNTQAIVLKRKNTKEADRILTLYTKKYGKIQALGKGVKKTTSKLAGHLEPFYLIQVSLVEGKTFKIISDAKTINNFKEIRDDLKKTTLAYFICEVIDKMTVENEENIAVFNLTKKTFEFLSREEKIDLVLSYFLFNFLSYIGFKPSFDYCVRCQKSIKGEKNLFFSYKDGGVVHQKCATKEDVLISPNLIKFLKLSEKLEIGFLKKIKTEEKTILEIEDFLTHYLELISEKNFKSKVFLKKIKKKI